MTQMSTNKQGRRKGSTETPASPNVRALNRSIRDVCRRAYSGEDVDQRLVVLLYIIQSIEKTQNGNADATLVALSNASRGIANDLASPE